MKRESIAVLVVAAGIGAAAFVAVPRADSIATTLKAKPDWLQIAKDCPNQLLQEHLFEQIVQSKKGSKPALEDGSLVEAYKRYAQVEYRAGNREKAALVLREGLQRVKEPADIDDLTYMLGWLLLKQDKVAEAENAFYDGYKRISGLGCESFGSRLMRQFYIARKDVQKEREFEIGRLNQKAYQSAEDHRQIVFELAELEAMENRPRQCLDWLTKIEPDNDDHVWMLRAWCADRLGQEKLADQYCKKAIATFGKYERDSYSSLDGVRCYYASFLRSKGRVKDAERQEELVRRDGHDVVLDSKSSKSEPPIGLRVQLVEAVQRYNPFDDSYGKPTRRSDLLGGLRFLYGRVVDSEDGIKHDYAQAGSDYERAAALDALCSFYFRQENVDRACETLNQLFALIEKSPDLRRVSDPCFLISSVPHTVDLLLSKKRVDVALALVHRYADYFNVSLGKDNCMSAFTLTYMAEHFVKYKCYREAEQCVREALSLREDRIKKKIDCGFPKTVAYKCLAVSQLNLGQLREAKATYELLLPLSTEEARAFGGWANLVENLNEYAQVCRQLGDTKDAIAAQNQIKQVLRPSG